MRRVRRKIFFEHQVSLSSNLMMQEVLQKRLVNLSDLTRQGKVTVNYRIKYELKYTELTDG